MRTLSVGMMIVTFVLGVGAISVLFLLGKVIVELARDKYRNEMGYAI